MRRHLFFYILLFFLVDSFLLQGGKKINVEMMPPVVVKTIPESGDIYVNPSLTEIKVTFSKNMKTDNMWSWVKISDETFPQIGGNIHYLKDQKTCVLPVRLEPGKTYIIWINSKKYNSFRDKNNNPAIPYLLVFETRE